MKYIKRILQSFAAIIGLLLILLLSVAGILFFKPTLIVNPKNLNFALKKTSVLNSWSWTKGEITHEWVKWNHRHLTGHFDNLCLLKKTPTLDLDTCMEEVSWNVDLSWDSAGFKYTIHKPLIIKSKLTNITLREDKSDNSDKPMPDIIGYWDMLWNPIIPDMDFRFQKINIITVKKTTGLDLVLLKNDQQLKVFSYGLELVGSKNKITVIAPEKMLIPMDLKTNNPLYFQELKFVADIKENDIPLALTAKIENANFKISSSINREFIKKKNSKAQLLSHVLLSTKGQLSIIKLVQTIEHLIRPPYNILPAPINSMEGDLFINLQTTRVEGKPDIVMMNITTSLDLEGIKQALIMDLKTDLPVELKTYAIGPIVLGLDLKKVALLLPKFSKTKMPPQLKPDPRFLNVEVKLVDRTKKAVSKKAKINRKIEYTMNLQALGSNALGIKTNLLDEVLKLNFDLFIEDKNISRGYVQTLPLHTTIFKRPIYIPSLRINFESPLEPELIATVEFHLPEYLITLKLDGPISKPRQAFSSVPPLPADDIFAVLLFGRPLSGLNADDKSAAAGANKILSQGIISLAVLYYFAGSPIESLGYDPDTKAVSAQFGLGSKNSLLISSGVKGGTQAGLRHSLGKGWYIESTVGKSSMRSGSSGGDYGVLLERIKSY